MSKNFDALADADFAEIRHRYNCGETMEVLASDYGIGRTSVLRIIRQTTKPTSTPQRRTELDNQARAALLASWRAVRN